MLAMKTKFLNNYNVGGICDDFIKTNEIKVKRNGGNIVIPVEQITYLEANINYTIVHTKDNSVFLSSRTIKHYEDLLDENIFVRVHKSHIVNVAYIRNFQFGKSNGEINLKCGKQVEVSRRKVKEISEKMTIAFI
jgi:two-component system, LytTR family, response regulator